MYAIEFNKEHVFKKKDSIIRLKKRGIPAIMVELEDMRIRGNFIYIIDKLPKNWKEMDCLDWRLYCQGNYIYIIYSSNIAGRW